MSKVKTWYLLYLPSESFVHMVSLPENSTVYKEPYINIVKAKELSINWNRKLEIAAMVSESKPTIMEWVNYLEEQCFKSEGESPSDPDYIINPHKTILSSYASFDEQPHYERSAIISLLNMDLPGSRQCHSYEFESVCEDDKNLIHSD